MKPTPLVRFYSVRFGSWLTTLRAWLSSLLTHAPLVLMSLLALGSFVLFKQAPSASKGSDTPEVKLREDYFVQRFFATEFKSNGEAKAYVTGASAQHNPQTKTLNIDQMNFLAKTDSALYQGSGKLGTVSDDSKLITLVGDAVVDKQSLASSGASRVHFSSDRLVLRQDPDSLEASNEAQLVGRVRIVIEGKTGGE